MNEPLAEKHVMHFVEGNYLTGDYIMPKRVKAAVEGLKQDIAKWDVEKIQGRENIDNDWDYGAIEHFIDKWFPIFVKENKK